MVVNSCFKDLQGRVGLKRVRELFQRQEKNRNERLKLSSDGILDFGRFTRRGCWRTLSTLQKYGGGGETYLRAGGRGHEGAEMVEYRKTTKLPAVRE